VRITLIIVAVISLYIFFSTLFLETALVGNLGKTIGETNLRYFGYFGYVNVLILLLPLWSLYKHQTLRIQVHFYLGWLLLFLALLFLTTLLFDSQHIGEIGRNTIEILLPFIGKAGMWLLWFMVVSVAFVLMVDEEWRLEESTEATTNVLKKIVYKTKELLGNLKEKLNRYLLHPLKKVFVDSFMTTKHRNKEMFGGVKQEDLFDLEPLESNVAPNPKPRMDVSKKYGHHRVTPQQKVQASPQVHHSNEMKHEIKVVPKAPPIETVEQPQQHIEVNIHEEIDKETSIINEPIEPPKVEKPTTVAKVTTKANIVDTLEENSKLMQALDKGKLTKPKNFKLPKIDFLQKAPKSAKKMNEAEIDKKIEELLSKLQQFKVEGDVIRTYSGPLVTTFEFKPAPNVKVSKILNLQDDLAMALAAETIRIQAPIPGRDVVGIEIPNESNEIIYLRDILESELFQNASSPLTIALGKDIVGQPFVTDIKKLPHILIAGTTGSGKSVGINAMILSLLYRNDPDHLKLMMIDPKMLEFSMYNDIPHLITPVITEPPKAIAALANMVAEMERRYMLMAEARTKNIESYNEKMEKESSDKFPFIVVIIDELADLMMNGGKEVELSIARLAQKSRACGIHLIVATQRPSVDVVTGLIKANLPSRLSYRVGQRIDSKVILDMQGAESLLGRGDGLFTPPGTTGLVRIHAPWSTEGEIDTIVEYLKAQRLPEYNENYLVVGGMSANKEGKNELSSDLDPLYEEAKGVVLNDKKTSISYLQRKLQIGYNRSANIIDQLEKTGVLSAPNAKGQREIL
jgi:S-DNA-T family DNA segregation ATPase FtsK/SpoIIIE